MKRLKKLNIIMFLHFIVTLSLSAQAPDIGWRSTYTTGIYTIAYGVSLAYNEGYVFAGEDFIGIDQLYFKKVSSTGTLEWIQSYTSPNYGSITRSLCRTLDGGFILCANNRKWSGYNDYDLHLIKTDSAGDQIWSKIYIDSTVVLGMAVIQLIDGGLAVAGNRDSSHSGINDIYLMRTDSIGTILWARTYGGSGDDLATAVQQTPDGGFIIAGNTNSFGAGGTDIYLVKADSSGDVVWAKTYGGINDDYCTAVQLADSGYIVGGYTNSFGNGSFDVYLMKVKGNGDTIWTRTFGGPADDRGYSLELDPNSNYVIAGSTESFVSDPYSRSDCYINNVDPNGNTNWTLHFAFTTSLSPHAQNQKSHAYSIKRTPGNGYIVAGAWSLHNTANDQSFSDAGLAKLNQGVNSVNAGGNSTDNYSLQQNFPNPFNPKTTISFTLPRSEFVIMTVFNVLGQQLATLISANFSVGTHQVELDAHGYSSGVYFCRLQAGSFIATKKLILVK